MKKYFLYAMEVLLILVAVYIWFLFRPPKNQKEWIEHQVSEMKVFSQDMLPLALPGNKSETRGNFLNEYAEHYFEFKNGGWAYSRVHSFHADHYWNDKANGQDEIYFVGDISITIDNNGDFYKSHEHACGWFYNEYARGYDLVGTNELLITIAPTNVMNDIHHFLELWSWKKM